MTEQPRAARANVRNPIFDSIEQIAKWLMKVATIAIGTCLGIILFVWVAREYASDKLDQLDLDVLRPSTSSAPFE